ncbi:MAG TPA: RDD family protein, partial [Pseudobdellovibrionaceae bacterium]|nr:RDD family protein [Pseudobdellovibrionaceae bacterium]
MVIADLTHPETIARSSNGEPRMALISDRLVAAVLDFLLFSPFVSLLCAKMMNQIKIQSLLDDSSGRLLASWVVYFSFMVFLVIVLEACSLYLLQATPGQYFLKLRVISYPHPSEKLTLGQALLRASLFTFSGLIMGVPFLEVLGHPLRRAMH